MSESYGSPTSQSPSEDDDMFQAAKNVKKLSAAEIKAFQDATVEAIAKNDVAVEGAVSSFFDNRIMDCLTWLNDHRLADPLAMTGGGLIAFLRYMLSMEQEHADTALREISEGSAYSAQLLKSEKGMFSKLGTSLSRKKETPESNWLKPGEYRAKTVHTESQALRALVLVLEASVVSLMKAGLGLRRAYNGYHSLYKEREEREQAARAKLTAKEREALGDKEIDIGLDRNSVYSVDVGLGAINIAISILPDGILKMLKILGFVGDRAAGVAMVKRCFASNTLLSPFASALLLAMLGALPLACSILYESYSPHVRKVVDETMENSSMNNSLLHLWLVARAELIHRDLDRSTELMMRCVKLSEEGQIKEGMPQLRNFVFYDLMGTYIIQHEWEKCREVFAMLLQESKWSDIFYTYGEACCYEMMAFECEQEGGSEDEVRRLKELASNKYWEAVHQKGTKMGGKIRAPDQLCGKRLEEMLELYDVPHPNRDYKEKIELTPLPEGVVLENTVPLPAYEIAFVFGLSLRMPHGIMKEMVANVDHVLVSKGLVKSPRTVREASAERRLAEQEQGRRVVENVASGTGEVRADPDVLEDDEEQDEEDFGDDEHDAGAAETTAVAAKHGAKKRHGESDGDAMKKRKGNTKSSSPEDEAVFLAMHVVALNQANDAYRATQGRKPANGALACNYVITALSGVKASFLANSELKEDRAAALKLIDSMLSAPAYKDKAWSLSYVQPNMLYEKACIVYKESDNPDNRASCEAILREYDKKYPDTHYYTHSMTEFRVHLAKCEFRNEKKEARDEAKKSKHADPFAS